HAVRGLPPVRLPLRGQAIRAARPRMAQPEDPQRQDHQARHGAGGRSRDVRLRLRLRGQLAAHREG
ncbi:hypothetical protein NYZ51_19490, partial [Acinetobacter baumannii]|nr:hypothetical protein [Acinetobacter baumannii]